MLAGVAVFLYLRPNTQSDSDLGKVRVQCTHSSSSLEEDGRLDGPGLWSWMMTLPGDQMRCDFELGEEGGLMRENSTEKTQEREQEPFTSTTR